MRVTRFARAAVALVVAGGAMSAAAGPATATPPTGWYVDEAKLPFKALRGTHTERLWGVHEGAGYRIEVPARWNGELVMYAHGYRGDGLELRVDNEPLPLRRYLIAHHYAWAASSYSRNGYAAAAGIRDTHALVELFGRLVGHPRRVYLTGASMGGHVTAASIERYPTSYAGAMPICGVLGDRQLFDWYLDYNLAAAALAHAPASFPADPVRWDADTVPAITRTLARAWPNGLTAQGRHLRDLTVMRSGGPRPLTDAAFASWASHLLPFGALEGMVPHSAGAVVDNTTTAYQFDADPALTADERTLNDEIARVTHAPAGPAGQRREAVPAVEGVPPVPVLTLHDLGDLLVPFSMEQVYAQRVAAAGRSDLVVQRAIRAVGHCDFTPAELVTGFTDLVRWVEHGVRPAGDDVLDPAAVADPAYGCRFTSATRDLGSRTAPCPTG